MKTEDLLKLSVILTLFGSQENLDDIPTKIQKIPYICFLLVVTKICSELTFYHGNYILANLLDSLYSH